MASPLAALKPLAAAAVCQGFGRDRSARPVSSASPAGQRNYCGRLRWHEMRPKRKPCSLRPGNSRPRAGPASGCGPSAQRSHSGCSCRSARYQLRHLVRHGRVGRSGRDRAVQEERECVPLGGGEWGRCLGQFPDPDVQAAAWVVCGVPVGVVTLVALGPAAGARPGCGPGSGFPRRRWSPGAHELKASY